MADEEHLLTAVLRKPVRVYLPKTTAKNIKLNQQWDGLKNIF